MSPTTLWIVTLLLFFFGFLGIFIPALPGLGLIFAGVLLYAWATGFTVITGTTVIVFGIIVLLTCLAEYFGSGIAARYAGGGRYAFMGSTFGAILGLLIASAPGLLLGAFIGGLLGAVSEGKSAQQASKIALVSLIGILASKVLQIVVAVAMIIAFFVAILL